MSQEKFSLFRGKTLTKFFLLFVVFGINAIIAKHIKMPFWDMNDKAFDKIKGRYTLSDCFIIFMPCVMKRNKIPVVVINSGTGNDRLTKVATDVFNCDIRSAKVWFGPNIKAIFMLFINGIFDFVERRPKSLGKLFKEDFTESIAKKVIVKVFNRSPRSKVASTPFRNKGVYMRIPFEIPAKGMKNADEARGKMFRLIHLKKHTKNNIADRMKEAVQ